MFARSSGALAVAALMALPAAAQPRSARSAAEVPFRFVAAESVRFDPPLLVNGPKSPGLRQAFLVTLEVDPKTWSALPPSIEPFLYVGTLELRPFKSEPSKDGGKLVITYYSEDAEAGLRAADDAPLVLTMEHGAPSREPQRFAARPEGARYRKELFTDRR
jgi:hypothetical protein